MEYRKEIDGLRALAVVSVMLFHANYSFFGGGYVGVDIFFVISGYLISSIIMKDLENNSFTLINFYEQRIRRIIPPLLFVVFFSTIFALAWLLPSELREFGKSLFSIPIFLSNFIFYLQGGYFDDNINLKPFGHTWSLGIEGQFYLIYPFFLLYLWKRKKDAFVFFVMIILSLLISHWCSIYYPRFAYFLLPSRIWEFFVGFLLSKYINNSLIKKVNNLNFLSEFLSFLGLLIIIFSIYYFNEKTNFPGLNALLPVIGTSLIILFTINNTFVAKLLSFKIFVNFGLISFSLYLWHQPLFVFFRIIYNKNPNQLESFFLLFLTVLLSFLTWKFIEKPFRNKSIVTRKHLLFFTAFPSLLFCLIGFYIFSTDGIGKLYSSKALINLYKIETIKDAICNAENGKSAKEIKLDNVCKFGKKNTLPEFAIIGDSHASTLFNYLNQIYSKEKAFVGFSNGNCAPLINGFKYGASIKGCREINEAIFEYISNKHSIKKIILYAEWSNYTEGYRIDSKIGKIKYYLAENKNKKSKKISENSDIFEKSLQKTISFLKKNGKEIIIIKSTPELEEKVMDSVARQIIKNKNSEIYKHPSITLDDYYKRNKKIENIFSKISNVNFLESKDFLCKINTCSSKDEKGNILYSDTNHLTYNGSKRIVDPLVELISYSYEKN